MTCSLLPRLKQRMQFVLVHPTEPGNIGATARAMKNMGLMRLCVVGNATTRDDPRAVARASGADDVLASALWYPTLDQALASSRWVWATSSRNRRIALPVDTPEQAACGVRALLPLSDAPDIAVVFGTERTGLSNDELLTAQRQLVIPTDDAYSSLNLAMACQIVAYCLRTACLSPATAPITTSEAQLATQAEWNGFWEHWVEALRSLDFLPTHDHKMLSRIQRLFIKAALETREIHILRGLCRAILKT